MVLCPNVVPFVDHRFDCRDLLQRSVIDYGTGKASAVGPTVSMNSHQALDRAEALFKKKEERLSEGQEAMAEYEADGHAMREKTARLRALRLARDAANNQAPILPARKRSALGE